MKQIIMIIISQLHEYNNKHFKKLLSFFPLSKYGLCPLSQLNSMIKNLFIIEKEQLILLINNIKRLINNIKRLIIIIYNFIKKYTIIIIFTKILTILYLYCLSYLSPYITSINNLLIEYYILIFPPMYFINPMNSIDILKILDEILVKYIPSKDFFTSIFERNININDIESNLGELNDLANVSIISFLLTFFKKQNKKEEIPLLSMSHKSYNTINNEEEWIDIEEEYIKENPQRRSYDELSIDSNLDLLKNIKKEENDFYENNYTNIINQDEDPFSLNTLNNNQNNKFSRKKKKYKIDYDKPLPPIPEEELTDLQSLNSNNPFSDSYKVNINTSDITYLEYEINKLCNKPVTEEEINSEGWNSFISNSHDEDKDYRDALDILVTKMEEDEDEIISSSEINSEINTDINTEEYKSFIKKLDGDSSSDIHRKDSIKSLNKKLETIESDINIWF